MIHTNKCMESPRAHTTLPCLDNRIKYLSEYPVSCLHSNCDDHSGSSLLDCHLVLPTLQLLLFCGGTDLSNNVQLGRNSQVDCGCRNRSQDDPRLHL